MAQSAQVLRDKQTQLEELKIEMELEQEEVQPGDDFLQSFAAAEESYAAEVQPVQGSVSVSAPPLGPDGKPDLGAMSFDERLEYLASVAPDVAAPKEEFEGSLFGFDGDKSETLWWDPKFYALCFDDLRTLNWPTPKAVVQTVVTSQIAFVAIFISVLVFDAFAEAFIRTLIQGKPFILSLDGSASPSRGV